MVNLIPIQRSSMEFKYVLGLRFDFWIENVHNHLVTSATNASAVGSALQKHTLGTHILIVLLLVRLNFFRNPLIHGLFDLTTTKLSMKSAKLSRLTKQTVF